MGGSKLVGKHQQSSSAMYTTWKIDVADLIYWIYWSFDFYTFFTYFFTCVLLHQAVKDDLVCDQVCVFVP